MINLFSYVKYSEASFQMSNQYICLLLITLSIWVLLWIGYRNNKINDDKQAKEKKIRIQSNTLKKKKLESLYPKRFNK